MKARTPFDPAEVCRVVIQKSEKNARHHQVIVMPNGDKIPYIVWTRVYDHPNDIPYVIAKILVNISEE